MQYLVTGATGTIGNQVVGALVAAGASVRAASRDPDSSKAPGAGEVVRLDFSDVATFPSAFAEVDRLFLLTPFVEDPRPMVEAAVHAARNSGCRHIVRLSVIGADPDSELRLARHHAECEQMIKDSGIAWSVIRPTFFMDNLLNFAGETIRSQNAFYGAAGEGSVAYVSSQDVGSCSAAILLDADKHESETYVLTGAQAHTESEVAGILTNVMGRTINYVSLEPEMLRAGMAANQLPEWMIETVIGLEAVKRHGWAEAVSLAVNEITGRDPQSLQSFCEAHRQQLT